MPLYVTSATSAMLSEFSGRLASLITLPLLMHKRSIVTNTSSKSSPASWWYNCPTFCPRHCSLHRWWYTAHRDQKFLAIFVHPSSYCKHNNWQMLRVRWLPHSYWCLLPFLMTHRHEHLGMTWDSVAAGIYYINHQTIRLLPPAIMKNLT